MINYTLSVDKLSVGAGDVTILNDISFTAQSGEVVAIMGPSGAGKTTLITCLTTPQIPKQYSFEGRVTLNGETLSKYRNSGKLIGYAPQFDVYYPAFTAGEHLQFKAELKFPMNISVKEREDRIKQVVEELRVDHCLDSRLGGEANKSMSGGEIKRIMVASEIITKPPILILDEPTTGLDSSAASVLISTLKKLAQAEQCIILLSLHQPSSEIYFSFDRVLWLAKGHLVADLTPKALVSTLDAIGCACPSGEVVSNHMMDLLQDAESYDKLRLHSLELIDVTANSEKALLGEHHSIEAILEKRQFPSRFRQFCTLTRRHWKLRLASYMTRDCIINKLIILAMLMTVWFGSWTGPFDVTTHMRTHMGYMWFHSQHWSYDAYFMSMGNMTTERNVTRSEVSTRVYGNVEYSLSRISADAFWMSTYAISLFALGLVSGQAWDIEAWRWFAMMGTLMLHTMGCISLSKLCCHFLRDERSAAIVGDLYLTLSFWVGGFYMKATTLPSPIRWFRWISEIASTFSSLVHFGYDDLTYLCTGAMEESFCLNGETSVTGAEAYATYGLTLPLWYGPLFLLVVFLMLEIGSISMSKYGQALRVS